MKKILKKFAYVVIALFAGVILVIGFAFIEHNNYLFYSTGINEKAFLNSQWLMSPNEIKRANSASLTAPEIEIFWGDPDVINRERYSAFVQKNLNLWGYGAEVEYLFFDNKLYEYYISINVYEIKKIRKEILVALQEKYGEQVKVKKMSVHLIDEYDWNTENRKIRFWIGKSNKKKRYHIGVRTTYLPFYKKLEEIADSEKKNYF